MVTVLMSVGRLVPFLAVILVLGACQPEPESSAIDRTNDADSAQAASPQEPTTTPPDQVKQKGDRTPKTDPWLFEGIPNFEDLVAGRDGDWLVVLGSSPHSGKPSAPTIMAAADPKLATAQRQAWNTGRVPFVVDSEEQPGLEPGFRVVVLGPYSKAQAEAQLAAISGVVPDAYLKLGW
jgi:hypothetical protein